jgi:predicted RNA-binding Zn ribbon-like protein
MDEMTSGDAPRGSATPEYAETLCAFANTLDVDEGITDELTDPGALTEWLRGRALVDRQARATASDLRTALDLRAGLRQAMVAHHDGHTDATLPGLDEIAANLPLRMVFEGTRPRLTPAVDGATAGLARLLIAMADAQTDGGWSRLKLCVADDCQWAFYDTSKNRSRHWCSMGVCGNRQKTRAYRARQRGRK